MQFIVEQPDLLNAIQTVQPIVDKKNTIPVLSNTLFEVDAQTQRAAVIATNLEIGMRTMMPLQTIEGGSITIPAQKLLEIVKELPNAPVTLTVDDKHWITLECQKARFRLAGLPKKDFPELPNMADPASLSLTEPQALFREMIAKTSFAVSHDESRYALTGVLIEFSESALTMVSTDGHRLASITRDAACVLSEGLYDDGKKVILPLKAMTEMKKMCAGTGDATLRVNLNHAIFQVGETVLVTRRIEAQFPDYKQVIPQAIAQTVPVDRAAFTQALRRVALLCSDTRLVKLDFKPGMMGLSTNDPSLGEARETIPLPDATTPLTIGFNARYVMDALSVIDGEPSFGLQRDELSPAILTGDAATDAGFVCVVMPMRV